MLFKSELTDEVCLQFASCILCPYNRICTREMKDMGEEDDTEKPNFENTGVC